MYSNGQTLFFEHGIKQAVCFSASLIDKGTRLVWSESFPKARYRGVASKIGDSALLLVISQNCDIAANKDELDSAIELVVCKTIKPKSVVRSNSFAISSRRLQFSHENQWYEASTEYIITVDKGELLSTIKESSHFGVISLSKEYQITVPIWRANRYYRTGLPNNFNLYLLPVLSEHMDGVELSARVEHSDYRSFIRAMYLKVDNLDEADTYCFEMFALLRDSVNDSVMTKIQQAIETMAEDLEIKSGFTDKSAIYADRESNTFVSYLNDFLRLNVDHHSLAQGDDDVGPDIQ